MEGLTRQGACVGLGPVRGEAGAGELSVGSGFLPHPERATKRPKSEWASTVSGAGDPESLYLRTMDLSEDAFVPSGDIGHYLETVSVVTTEEVLLFSSG